MDKIWISARDLLRDSFLLAAQVHASGFRPDFIVGVWRGGTPVGIAVQEYFEFRGVKTDHIAVRTASYTGIAQQSDDIQVFGLEYLLDRVEPHHALLLVDDVFDSGRSFKALLDALAAQAGQRMPAQVRLAAPWYKPRNSKVDLVPDYCLHQTDAWLVFPHELMGLALPEILEGKADLAGLEALFSAGEASG